MAWQQTGGYAYPNQQGPPPPGFFPSGGAAPYPAPGPYPSAGAYPGGAPYPTQPGYPGAPGYPGQQAGYPAGGAYPQNNMPNYSDYGTGSAAAAGSMGFSEKTIRMGFIRKVYSILMMQLAITAFFITLFITSKSTSGYFAQRPAYVLVAFVVVIVCMLSMACCEGPRRTAPMNYIFLFVFTFAESFLLGVISATYKMNTVLLAVGICTVLCFALTVFAFQTKIDFTAMGGILFVAVIILFVFGIVLMFFDRKTFPILHLVYACFGAFLFSVYLIYDTQMMIGGDHKYSISPEEYVFAALTIYLDIINIFLYILAILGETRD